MHSNMYRTRAELRVSDQCTNIYVSLLRCCYIDGLASACLLCALSSLCLNLFVGRGQAVSASTVPPASEWL